MNARKVYIFYLLFSVFSLVIFLLPFGHKLFNSLILLMFFLIVGALIYKFLGKTNNKSNSELNELKKKIMIMSNEIQACSSQLSSVAEELNVSLDENNELAQNVFDETTEMTELNSDVNKNIQNTMDEIKNIINLINNVDSISEQLKSLSTNSNETINNTRDEIVHILDSITRIKKYSTKTKDQIKSLSDVSKQIVSLIETVSNISKQTHMLALNASIESARAGEAGKGFAVVAEEIRKLANESAKAVEGVGSLIENIQHEISEVNEAVEVNMNVVDNGVKSTTIIKDKLDTITSVFENVTDMVCNLEELCKKEASLTTNMDDSIHAVKLMMKESAVSVDDVFESVKTQKASIENVASMGLRLNMAADNLAKLVDNNALDNQITLDSNVFSTYSKIFEGIRDNLSKDLSFLSLDKVAHKNLLTQVLDSNEFIEAIWTNDLKGRFICSIPEAGIANGAVREWFKKAIQGEMYISTPYISAITKNPCITLSLPLYNNKNIIGVIGIDIKLNK